MDPSANLARNKFIRRNTTTALSPFFFANLIAAAIFTDFRRKVFLAISALRTKNETPSLNFSRICADTPPACAKRPRHTSRGKLC